MISIKSANKILCVAIVLLNLNQYDTKTVEKDSDEASMLMDKANQNSTTAKMTNNNATNSSLINRFIDLDGIMQSFFPIFNTGGESPHGNSLNYPNNGFQLSNPQENNWNNGNWDAPGSINYPDSPQNYPGQNVQGSNPQNPGKDFNNFNGGNYPVNPYPPQVNNPQYPGNDFNNFNGGNYPVSPNFPQGNNPKYPGNGFNNLNGGTYPVNPNVPQDNNHQQYPGNDFNNNNNLNGGKYPVNPNVPQGNNPQYPGNSFNNLNGGTYPVNANIPQVIDNNQQYPGNDYNNFNGGTYAVNPNIPQGTDNNQQNSGNDYKNLNGGAYLVNPNFPQSTDPQYPGAGSNLDISNNWNNNRYPAIYQNRPSYPNEQAQYPDNGGNNLNGLQNNQNPNLIVFPEDQVPVQGVQHGQPPTLNQGQPQDPQGTFQNGNTGSQNGGSFNPQNNGVNNVPSGSLQRPLLQYPQTNRPEITNITTEKVAILGLPVTVSNEFKQKPLVTTSTSSAMKQCVQDCPTTSEYNPVCGSNNVTYFNEGKIECARYCGIDVTAQRVGACTIGSTPGVFG